jgi:hypothetical protein
VPLAWLEARSAAVATIVDVSVRLSAHAVRQAARRGIPERVVLRVANNPDQVVSVRNDREIRQSRVAIPGSDETMLVRVIVDRQGTEDLVVTVYRTSKIGKYWTTP